MTCKNRHILTVKNKPMLAMNPEYTLSQNRQDRSTSFKGAVIYNMKLKLHILYRQNILKIV